MRQIPLVSNDKLIRRDARQEILVGTDAWFDWLKTATIFAVADPKGHFIVSREHLARDAPWYASQSKWGKVRRVYVGQSANITRASLKQTAARLSHIKVASLTAIQKLHTQHVEKPVEFLTTKLVKPPLRPALIERTSALSRLRQATNFPLTIVSAPAGYGKATLLAQWLATTDLRVAWVTLDANDADPTRFWTYVVMALDPYVHGLARLMLPKLQRPTLQLTPDELTALINLLAAAPDPVLLVLNDYHTLGDAAMAIHTALAFIVEHLPANIHIVLAGRSDPPLPLAQLRAHGHLNELHTGDLQFTLAEATLFLTRMPGATVPMDEIIHLYSHIEGWITGWQLAALSFQGRADIAALADAFDGRNRYVVDFLSEEVLKTLPPDRVQFLLQTAPLDRLTADLCDAVTQSSGSQHVLDDLEHANIFLVPLDEKHQWYRYQHIFAEALRLLLRQTRPELLPAIYLRASAWCKTRGYTRDAIDYAFMAEDATAAASIIASVAGNIFATEGLATSERWLAKLPDALIRSQSDLCIAHANVLLLDGQLALFEQRVRAAENTWEHTQRQMSRDEREAAQVAITAFNAVVTALHGRHLQCLALSRYAQWSLPKAQDLASQTILNLGIAAWLNGDVQTAAHVLDDLRHQSERHGDTYTLCRSTTSLVHVLMLQGRLREAHAHCAQALQRAATVSGSLETQAIFACLGIVHSLWNDLDQAASYLERGLTPSHSRMTTVHGYCALSWVRHAQGNADGAMLIAEEVMAREESEPFLRAFARAYQAQLWAALGDIEAAGAWASDYEAGREQRWQDESVYLHEFEQLVLARVYLAQNRPADALGVLTDCCIAAEESGRMGRVLEIRVLQAAAYHAQRNSTRAITTLQHAIEIAEPEGIVQPFIAGGGALRELLMHVQPTSSSQQRGTVDGKMASFLNKVLAALGEAATVTPPAAVMSMHSTRQQPPSAIVSLSTREKEVLRLLARGASNLEIARLLVIEMGTVKRHLSNIYTKLGAQSRSQAIAQAHALRLLDEE